MSDVGISFHFDQMGAGLALGYLLGTVPFGLFFTWASGAGDVRKIGSGNIGATNVLRSGKRWAAAATLLFDAAKGATAVLLARHFLGHDTEVFAGLGAVLGHLFPVWLRFKGGKGVATFLGVCLALQAVGLGHSLFRSARNLLHTGNAGRVVLGESGVCHCEQQRKGQRNAGHGFTFRGSSD